MDLISLGIGLVIAVIAAVIAFSIGKKQAADAGALLKAEAQKSLDEAQTRARQMVVDAKEEAVKTRDNAERDGKARRNEALQEEDRVKIARRELDSQRTKLDQTQRTADKRQSVLDKRETDLDKIAEREAWPRWKASWKEVAGMSARRCAQRAAQRGARGHAQRHGPRHPRG